MRNLMIIFATGMLGISKAVPVGIMLNISPPSICVMTVLGSSSMSIALYLSGGWIRELAGRVRRNGLDRKKLKTGRLVSKFGVAGLGLLGTVIMGPNITILMGVLVVKEKAKLLTWTMIGIFLWTVTLTVTAALSSELLCRVLFFR
jgi:hypothetical protein